MILSIPATFLQRISVLPPWKPNKPFSPGQKKRQHWALGVSGVSCVLMKFACREASLSLVGPGSLTRGVDPYAAVMNKTITPPSGTKHDYMSWAP